jgi:sugar transferase (PEP-CTERM system associated)
MVRLFNVYYPTRTLLLLLCEAFLVSGVLLLTATYQIGPDTYIALIYENGILKILGITTLTLLLSYYFDLYEPQRISGGWEIYFRLMLVLSVLCFVLGAVVYFFPGIYIGPHVLTIGISALAVVLVIWRQSYEWFLGLSVFRERVYVLGNGHRAQTVIALIRGRNDAGMEIVDGDGRGEFASEFERFAADLRAFNQPRPPIDRVIVAMENRRGAMPVRELLDLRLRGVVIEDANLLMERLLGKLAIDGLNPSTLIFTHGFNVKATQQILRRVVSFSISFTALVVCLPIIPVLMLAVRLSSPGPIFFRQTRVGLRGKPFEVVKFRTMRQDAEKNGAQWAKKNDSRVTGIGRFMRKTRLDEIPQLWNVLKGEMGFVGPRPERPEFVDWLSSEIPFYELRHIIRPGLTGWAQVRYGYGSTLDETKHKLEYDLYYVKHMSVGLDLLVAFETVKTILLRRGAQ